MTQEKTKGLSLFFRLLAAMLVIVTLISGILTTVFYVYSKRSVETQTREHIQQQFATIGYNFQARLGAVLVKDLNLMASNPILDDFIMSSTLEREVTARGVEQYFVEYLRYSKNFESIAFANSFGNEVVKVNRSGRVRAYRTVAGSPVFVKVKAGHSGSIAVNGPFKDQDGNVLFTAGIYKTDADIGQFGGVVLINYSLMEFLGYLDKITIFDENPLWILTPEGTVLKQPSTQGAYLDPRPFLTKTFHQKPSFAMVDGGMLVYQDFYVNAERPLLRLVVSIPSSLLLRDTQSVLRFFLLVAAAGLIIVSVIAYYLARYLSRPIIELAHAASRLAKGDLTTRVSGRSSGEVQLLIDSFNRMSRDLEKTTVSKNYVSEIIASMRDTLIVASTDGTISRINMAASFLLGYDETELIGQQLSWVVLDEPGAEKSTLDMILENSSINLMEKTYLDNKGKMIPMLFSASVMRGIDGQVQGVVCVAQDITERKKAEDALRESAVNLSATLNATADGILASSAQGKVLFFNQGFAKMWNIPQAILDTGDDNALLGHVLAQLTDPDAFLREVQRLYAVAENSFDTVHFKDGRVFERYSFPMRQEGKRLPGRVWSFRDITERKKAEERLQAYSAELGEINEELKSFAYIVSHDLRAPLVNIKGFSDELIHSIREIGPILEKYLAGLPSEEQGKFSDVLKKDIPEALTFIGSSVSRMDNLINAILKLSRAGRRDLSPEPISVQELVGTIANSLSHQLGAKNARVTIPEGLPDVVADRTALGQIFGNLLDNAVKYLEPGRAGSIEVLAEHEDGDVVFHVRDNGRGMTHEDIPRAFEIFRRVGRQDVPGEGMGLAYVKTLVRLLGGRIWCESEPGKGTTFSFALPLARSLDVPGRRTADRE